MREAEDWDPNLRKISRGAIIYSYGWPLDIYGAYHRLSNTWLTRIIAYCLDVADLFLMPLEIVNICLTYWSLHWFLYGISDFLLCRSEWPDILLASAIQLFNVEITFKHAFSTQLDFWDLTCLSIKWGRPCVDPSFSVGNVFRTHLDICQCRQDKMGERKTALFQIESKCPPIPIHKTELLKVPTLYIYGHRGAQNFQAKTRVWMGKRDYKQNRRARILRMINESWEPGRDPPPTPCLLACDWLLEQWRKWYVLYMQHNIGEWWNWI